MKFFSHISRDFLVKRLAGLESWLVRMSIITVLITIGLGMAMAVCQKTGIVYGVEVGLICAIPMLVLMLLPFLLAQFFVEVTRYSEFHVPAPNIFLIRYSSFFPSVFLPVPISPPRTRLA